MPVRSGTPGGRPWSRSSDCKRRWRNGRDYPDHDHAADLALHGRALLDAGFAETDTVWQHLTDRVLVAVR
jgi:hypothetical protein